MSEIIHFFNQLNFNLNILESAAVLSSIIYVLLAAKQNIWCWIFAAISTILYIYICFSAQLFAETGLQFFYLFMAGYGYYNWNKSDHKKIVIQWKINNHIYLIICASSLAFLIGFLLKTYTEATMPIIDSFTTVFAIITTYMVAKKVLENWLYWIIIDSVSVYLYFNKDLYLTSLLFILYTIIAIFGYFSLIKKMKANA